MLDLSRYAMQFELVNLKKQAAISRTTELCEASTKLHFLSAALWWYLFAFVMPGIGECNPPLPEGRFPLSQSSRAQGLQEVGRRPVQRTVKRRLVEAIVSRAGGRDMKCSRREPNR